MVTCKRWFKRPPKGPEKQLGDIPVASAEDLEQADGIIFGVPTRFGNMVGQMRMFLDARLVA